jgi:purine-binding chemotaxis protein CheW
MTHERIPAPATQDRLAACGEEAMDAMNMADATPASWLICRIGGSFCALRTDAVVEIMRMLPIEELAGAPDYVRGLSIIRGVPAPVVDAGAIIGHGAGEPTRLIAVKAAARIIALAVDGVIGITAIAAETFGELPPLLRDAATDAIAAIGVRDGELLVFLRGGRLVPDDVLARLDDARVPS